MRLLALVALLLMSSAWSAPAWEAEAERVQRYVRGVRGVFSYPGLYPDVLEAYVKGGGTLALAKEIVSKARIANLTDEDINVLLEFPLWGLKPEIVRDYYSVLDFVSGSNSFDPRPWPAPPVRQAPVGALAKFILRGGTPALLKEWIRAYGAFSSDPQPFQDFFADAAVHAEALPSAEDIREARKRWTNNMQLNQAIIYRVESFSDTALPNAVFSLPAVDENLAFINPNTLEFLRDLRRTYDVHVVLAKTEGDVCEGLLKTPEIDALVLGGHGTRDVLSFGDADPRFSHTRGHEGLSLDKTDREFAACLKNLTRDARIFLNSCSNAEGGAGADNLARTVWQWSGGRQVFASSAPFDEAYVTVAFPLEVKTSRPAGRDLREDTTVILLP